MPMLAEPRTYRPEITPTRGEPVAWMLSGAALATLVFVSTRSSVPGWMYVFVGFLLFSALSISLGNWVERNTQISIDAEGVSFANGLRNVRLTWSEIKELRTTPVRWGDMVQVLGASSHFEFHTLGEVKFQGDVKGRVGFAQGHNIREQIVLASGLTAVRNEGQSYYYSRP